MMCVCVCVCTIGSVTLACRSQEEVPELPGPKAEGERGGQLQPEEGQDGREVPRSSAGQVWLRLLRRRGQVGLGSMPTV